MSDVASTVFHKMCFPHQGKIVIIDHLTYYQPASVTSLESIILLVSDKQSSSPCTSVSPGVYKDSSLLGAFLGPPPPISRANSMSVCMLQVSRPALKQSSTSNQQPTAQHLEVAIPAEPSRSTPPRPPSFVGASPMFPPGTVPQGLNHLGVVRQEITL